MDSDKLIYRRKFSKNHAILSAILFALLLMKQITAASEQSILHVIGMVGIICIDYSIQISKLYQKINLWLVLRFVEMLLLSIIIFGMQSGIGLNLIAVMLVNTYLEIMIERDITDNYARTAILLITGVPVLGYLLYLVLKIPKDHMIYFDILISYAMLFLLIYIVSDFLAHAIRVTENRVYELRRVSEHLKVANETLSKQQEKIRKANEELGIQKIKLESAYNRINNVNTETMIQNMILKYISSSLEITTIMGLITESVSESMALDICAIIIEPETAGNDNILYQVRTCLGEKTEELLSRKIELGCLNKYIKEDGTYVDNHVDHDNYPFLYGKAVNSLLIVPLIKEDSVLGALICGKQKYEFFHDNIPFFENVVTQLLVAIHNAGLYAKMQQMAIKDSLTGIYNRGQLNVKLDQFSKQALENKTPLSVALLDIDHFKNINDTYGHLFGDVVIKAIAGFAQEVAKKYQGIAARYGGEEFVLVLPQKKVEESAEIIREMQERINRMHLKYEQQFVTTRVSIGLSNYPETSEHITELLNRADEAMYYAKQHGRNQLVIDSDEIYELVKNRNNIKI